MAISLVSSQAGILPNETDRKIFSKVEHIFRFGIQEYLNNLLTLQKDYSTRYKAVLNRESAYSCLEYVYP